MRCVNVDVRRAEQHRLHFIVGRDIKFAWSLCEDIRPRAGHADRGEMGIFECEDLQCIVDVLHPCEEQRFGGCAAGIRSHD